MEMVDKQDCQCHTYDRRDRKTASLTSVNGIHTHRLGLLIVKKKYSIFSTT